MSRKGYTKLVDAPTYDNYSASAADTDARKEKAARSHGSNFSETSSLSGEVQNVKTKKVYVFSDGTVADNEDETMELTQMTRRGPSNDSPSQRTYKTMSSSQYEDIVTKEIPLHKTDTLQSLSIKFRCAVPELKRINGLYTDQEFYALTSIKIPVRSHQRLLQQELEEVARHRMTSSLDEVVSKKRCTADIVSSETSEDEEHGLSAAAASQQARMDMVELHSDPEDRESYALLDRDWSSNKHQTMNESKQDKKKFDKILNRKDEEIKAISEKVQRQANGADEVTAFMIDPNFVPPAPRPRNCLSTITLSVPCLIISIVVVVIVAPLILYFGFIRKPPHLD